MVYDEDATFGLGWEGVPKPSTKDPDRMRRNGSRYGGQPEEPMIGLLPLKMRVISPLDLSCRIRETDRYPCQISGISAAEALASQVTNGR